MVRIKVCGLTRESDLRLVQDLGADFIGLIFFSGSPRSVSEEKARSLLHRLEHRALRVGVFVNEAPGVIRRIAGECDLDIVQLHGDETPDYCRRLGLPCWKALRIKAGSPLPAMRPYACDAFLLDAFSPGSYGGSGRRVDRRIIRSALASGARIVVAGGVGEKNVGEILDLNPYAVDVNSSLEAYPGIKNEARVREFFQTIRSRRGNP